ncbi:MAG: hypothetical protein HQK79_18050 [Desulfobacterales bacterium]|nr:hypothetical protein [Desulfobacterales bacterium]
MKITNSDAIKTGERELIDTITAEIDWEAVETIFKERHRLDIKDDVEYKQGDIVVYNNNIAYKLDFEVKLTLSILVDREGNSLSLGTSGDIKEEEKDLPPDIVPDINEKPEVKKEEPKIEETEIVKFNVEEEEDVDIIEDIQDFDEELPLAKPKERPKEDMAKMASKIADMISEINEK